ncbi:hypothetical protein [Paraburkholderia rhizosphaerae]|uniref:Uncharacterized protein n=1 Tax=Paraburkholderia rhizosphaerae TaxID=480658 RepID=A0A4R8M2Y1_9BURK|nr:hypothetical protein [Paraburkholderia rhizosphaerae]TDY54778.1 hypothetical protein BX592_101234 [Paraburkholderia rhizosphaerae]
MSGLSDTVVHRFSTPSSGVSAYDEPVTYGGASCIDVKSASFCCVDNGPV